MTMNLRDSITSLWYPESYGMTRGKVVEILLAVAGENWNMPWPDSAPWRAEMRDKWTVLYVSRVPYFASSSNGDRECIGMVDVAADVTDSVELGYEIRAFENFADFGNAGIGDSLDPECDDSLFDTLSEVFNRRHGTLFSESKPWVSKLPSAEIYDNGSIGINASSLTLSRLHRLSDVTVKCVSLDDDGHSAELQQRIIPVSVERIGKRRKRAG